jgi:hypothetical protein
MRMAFVLFVIIAGFYWKLTLTRQYDWIWGPDLATQVLPWFQLEARQWHSGSVPLWDPSMWGGQPLIGQAQPGVVYPLNWILFLIPLRNGLIRSDALQWYFVVIHLMAAAFCYLLCRDLGRSRAASLVGGLVFALSGYIGETGWPQMVNGAVWLPLIFLFLLRAAHGRNLWGSAALSGMFLGVAWLSGHHQIPIFTSLAVAGTWLYFIFRTGRLDRRFAKAALVAFLFTGLTGAVQILPAYEYGHLAKRWVNAPEPVTWNQSVPYTVHENYDLKGFNLFGIVFPDVRAHFDPFVGVVALSLALLALAACWRDLRVRLLAAVGLGGLLYALGHYSVFQGFLYGVIPSLDKARTPAASIVVFEFGIAVLAAFGLDQLLSRDPSPWPRRVMWASLSFGLLTLATTQVIIIAKGMSFPGDDRVVITGVIALLLAALLFACLRGAITARQAGVLLVLLVIFEMGNNPASVVTERTDHGRTKWLEQMRANADVAAFLKKQPGYFRAAIPDDSFVSNWGDWHGVPMWGGLLASVTVNQLSYEFFSHPSRMLWGVAYTLSTKPTGDSGEEVFAGTSGLKVYKQSEAFPRAWSVHSVQQVPNMDEGNLVINQHLPDLRNMAFVVKQKPPAVESCGGPDDVAIYDYRPGRVGIRTNMACRGMLVLSDTFYPGWRAAVDGKGTGIYEVNGAMRGILVPRGKHIVTFRYLPASVVLGALLSLLGVAGAVFLGRWGQNRK